MEPETLVVPITHSNGFRGFDHWDRAAHVASSGLMDLWAREVHDQDQENHSRPWRLYEWTRAGTPVIISEAIQAGFGVMHLDDWIPPYELIGPVTPNDRRTMQRLLANDEDKWTQVKVPVRVRNVFEVKLNVSDFQPHEIKVTTCYGLVTIQGQESHEDTAPGEEPRHFKRTLMLPHGVSPHQLHAKLGEDGHLILCAPVTGSRLADQALYSDEDAARLSTIAAACKEQELWAVAVEAQHKRNQAPKT